MIDVGGFGEAVGIDGDGVFAENSLETCGVRSEGGDEPVDGGADGGHEEPDDGGEDEEGEDADGEGIGTGGGEGGAEGDEGGEAEIEPAEPAEFGHGFAGVASEGAEVGWGEGEGDGHGNGREWGGERAGLDDDLMKRKGIR